MGVQWDGVPLGRFGRASAFSFQSYKLMDGGEGGMLVTDDREIAVRALLQAGCYDRNWRLHFLPEDDLAWLEAAVNFFPAFGLRMSNLTASALRPQMARIDDRVASHRDRYLQVVRSSRTARFASLPTRTGCDRRRTHSSSKSRPWHRRSSSDSLRTATRQGVPLQVFGLDRAIPVALGIGAFPSSGTVPRTRDLLSRLADVPLPLWLDDRSLSHFVNVIRTGLIEAGAAEAEGKAIHAADRWLRRATYSS